MALRLQPFPADRARLVSGWAQTHEEVLRWCSHPVAPVPARQINAWASETGCSRSRFTATRSSWPTGSWVDDDAAEVEIARLIVDPVERRQGLAATWRAGWPAWPGAGIRGSS